MPRQKNHDLEKVTLNLNRGQFTRMGELYPLMGGGVAIRALIDKHIKRVHAKIAHEPRLLLEDEGPPDNE